MKLLIYAAIFFAFSISIFSQENSNIIIGKYDYNQWLKETGWIIAPKDQYIPSDSVISLLKPIVAEQKLGFIIFAGSWCGDTKSELPKIVSVLKSLGVELTQIPIYGVDRDKYEPSFASKRMNIKKVPTLIITYQNEELSRIEEFPQKESTWELDILRIFR